MRIARRFRPLRRDGARRSRLLPVAAGAVGLALVAACGSAGGGPTPKAANPSAAAPNPVATSPAANVPSNTTWLCKPGLADNPCDTSTAATVITATGATSTQPAQSTSNEPVDCFYVYPTVSGQKTANATLAIDPEETAIAIQQASRYSPSCRIYAPMYRQVTLAGAIGAGDPGHPKGNNAAAAALAYSDVKAAWADYLAHDNDGRGFVLIGHSQGSGWLIQLMKQEIDNNPAVRKHLVSAILLGGNVTVPVGKDVGGDFQNIPACRRQNETGCVVAYSSYLDDPPATSMFGRVPGSTTTQILCTNPGALGGGSAPLLSYFNTTRFPGQIGSLPSVVPSAPTPWVEYPNLYTGQCETIGGATVLKVTDLGTASDKRQRVTQAVGPDLGLHLYDVNIAYGNLTSLVHSQVTAYVQHG